MSDLVRSGAHFLKTAGGHLSIGCPSGCACGVAQPDATTVLSGTGCDCFGGCTCGARPTLVFNASGTGAGGCCYWIWYSGVDVGGIDGGELLITLKAGVFLAYLYTFTSHDGDCSFGYYNSSSFVVPAAAANICVVGTDVSAFVSCAAGVLSGSFVLNQAEAGGTAPCAGYTISVVL